MCEDISDTFSHFFTYHERYTVGTNRVDVGLAHRSLTLQTPAACQLCLVYLYLAGYAYSTAITPPSSYGREVGHQSHVFVEKECT